MEFGNFTITKREILVSIAITFILIGIGFFISSTIQNAIYEKNEKYYKALKIESNKEQFKYAINTNIGNTFAQGKVQATNSVSINDIEGNYFKIKKVKEKYTKHIRQVAHTRKVGNTTQTYYTTEEYWTWDYAGKEEWHTEKFEFLGVEFDYATIKFNNEQYKDIKKVDRYTRYKYYTIPSEFEGTLFTYISNNTITENEFYLNDSINNIIDNKQNEVTIYNVLFWLIWIILIFIIDFVYMYFENNYLEG